MLFRRHDRETQSYTASSSPLTILGINQESRHEGLTIYKELALGGKNIIGAYVDALKDRVYLNSDFTERIDSRRER
jgi:hypothetical protein